MKDIRLVIQESSVQEKKVFKVVSQIYDTVIIVVLFLKAANCLTFIQNLSVYSVKFKMLPHVTKVVWCHDCLSTAHWA